MRWAFAMLMRAEPLNPFYFLTIGAEGRPCALIGQRKWKNSEALPVICDPTMLIHVIQSAAFESTATDVQPSPVCWSSNPEGSHATQQKPMGQCELWWTSKSELLL